MKIFWNVVGKSEFVSSRDLLVSKKLETFSQATFAGDRRDGPPDMIEDPVKFCAELRHQVVEAMTNKYGKYYRGTLVFDLESFYTTPWENSMFWSLFVEKVNRLVQRFKDVPEAEKIPALHRMWYRLASSYIHTVLDATNKACPWAAVSMYGYPSVPPWPLKFSTRSDMQSSLAMTDIINLHDADQIHRRLDAICPDLYLHEDFKGNEPGEVTLARIKEAKRVCPGKPMYAYYWWQWHSPVNVNGYGGEFHSRETWDEYLKAAVEGGLDGIILWAYIPWHATETQIEAKRTQDWLDNIGIPGLRRIATK